MTDVTTVMFPGRTERGLLRESSGAKASASQSLIDQLVETIDSVGSRLSQTPEEERPTRVVVLIVLLQSQIIDSTHSTKCVQSRVHEQHWVYKWVFLYARAVPGDVFGDAHALGIEDRDTIFFKNYEDVLPALERRINGEGEESFTQEERETALGSES